MARRRGSARRRRRGGSGFLYKLLSVFLICGCLVAAITLFFRVDTVVITGEKRYTEAEIRQALKKEAALVEQKLPKGGALIAMCIEGQEMSSVALSQKMQQLAARGASQLTFLIGSSFGLDEDLKKKADLRLSMSPMTFPHHLARVMLLEQIYRAYQIEAGTKYHK